MEKAIVVNAIGKYGLKYRQIFAPQSGYRNEIYPIDTLEGRRSLVVYKNEPGILQHIKHANAIGNYLASNGMAARQQIDNRILKLQSQSLTRYAALYNYLPGQTIAWEAYTKEHIKSLGQTMANMHSSLEKYSGPALPSIVPQSIQLLHTIEAYMMQSGVQQALFNKLGLRYKAQRFDKLFAHLQQSPHLPALHMDFVRGNILFTGNRITGIIDFEKAASGPAIFDIGRTLAFLYIDCKYKLEPQVFKYFLQSGYIKRGQRRLTYSVKLLQSVIYFYLLHDFYKFLVHNPYEYLEQNEHYLRTRDMLVRGGLLSRL